MEGLFESFESVPVGDFKEMSIGVFAWLEEHCKPQALRTLVTTALEESDL